ncbi:malonate decarboxylase acyl carrier protein [Pseudazoarcus pumilus]|uniref:Malonate decarboxylase acyl carrier protein n=1 Tax=Pseudazoarcus pumilus TaxID=2067960 RepID=A0A2I6SA78_9RHOO|nr:malonate decarboxylase acyl carrier protein [Pseudazoarcus pumilus]AUN96145.1 malonate decarboxylase acyl carrier protein [Pseudazoarcus pumilus]
MEHLEFSFDHGSMAPANDFAHAGVVGSGNLEVLLERAELSGRCEAVVDTAIRGYERTWHKVLSDFVTRQGLADVRISINDGGATPAVVCLRLDQAAADLKGAPA